MNGESVFATLLHCIHTVLPDTTQRTVSPHDRLVDLGANSIDRSEIVMMALDELSLRVPLSEIHGPTNVGQLAELLHAKLRALG